MPDLVPTIFTTEVLEVEKRLKKALGLVSWLHLDLIDGLYISPASVSPSDLEKIKLLRGFKLGFHLMVKEPLSFIEKIMVLNPKRIISQIEAIDNQEDYVEVLKDKKIEAGLALDFGTGINLIKKEVFSKLDYILIMLYKAGWGGGKPSKERMDMVKSLKEYRDKNNFSFKIIVDGGINENNIKSCLDFGADILAVGDAIWKSDNIKEGIFKLRSIIHEN